MSHELRNRGAHVDPKPVGGEGDLSSRRSRRRAPGDPKRVRKRPWALHRQTRTRHNQLMGPDTELVVVTEELTRRFGDLVAVDGLDLEVRQGSVFGLLGRNGAGKSTTIEMLITLLAPSHGTARVAGYDIRSQAAMVRRVIGYLPQMVSADGSLTAWENLLVFSRLYHVPRTQRRTRIEHALALMGLESAAHKLVREFSGGMVRRLEIVQSMLYRPAVLFLDALPPAGCRPVARRGDRCPRRCSRHQLPRPHLGRRGGRPRRAPHPAGHDVAGGREGPASHRKHQRRPLCHPRRRNPRACD